MDIIQQYIKQELGDNVPPFFSDTICEASRNGVINLNFTNEKVKVILVTNLWISNPTGVAFSIVDQYGLPFVNSAAAPVGNTIMCPLNNIHKGAIIIYTCNVVTVEFSLFFQKVYSYNEYYNL